MTMLTDEQEKKMLIDKLQWAQMRFREATAELQVRLHELQIINQAVIAHLGGRERDDGYDNRD